MDKIETACDDTRETNCQRIDGNDDVETSFDQQYLAQINLGLAMSAPYGSVHM